jgi:hypothetical protein
VTFLGSFAEDDPAKTKLKKQMLPLLKYFRVF